MLWTGRGKLTGGCWLRVRSAKEYTTFWEGLGLLGLYCLYVFGVSLVGHGCKTRHKPQLPYQPEFCRSHLTLAALIFHGLELMIGRGQGFRR